MAIDQPRPEGQHSRGPWFIKAAGHWGTGRHSINDFEVYVVDLGLPPPDDDLVPDAQASATTFIPAIDEDVEPEPGLDVPLGNYVLTTGAEGLELVRVKPS